ncbi:hypothetical protein HQQ80_04390 [Microbacteriaceae bacterium VKM Ac-2855]|nr:hypothetical protein [Microbacteriaceae bacterium VKM Ac-2855]
MNEQERRRLAAIVFARPGVFAPAEVDAARRMLDTDTAPTEPETEPDPDPDPVQAPPATPPRRRRTLAPLIVAAAAGALGVVATLAVTALLAAPEPRAASATASTAASVGTADEAFETIVQNWTLATRPSPGAAAIADGAPLYTSPFPSRGDARYLLARRGGTEVCLLVEYMDDSVASSCVPSDVFLVAGVDVNSTGERAIRNGGVIIGYVQALTRLHLGADGVLTGALQRLE